MRQTTDGHEHPFPRAVLRAAIEGSGSRRSNASSGRGRPAAHRRPSKRAGSLETPAFGEMAIRGRGGRGGRSAPEAILPWSSPTTLSLVVGARIASDRDAIRGQFVAVRLDPPIQLVPTAAIPSSLAGPLAIVLCRDGEAWGGPVLAVLSLLCVFGRVRRPRASGGTTHASGFGCAPDPSVDPRRSWSFS